MTKPAPLAVSVTRMIKAEPATVYDLISDITRMNQFSPETVRTSWLDGATEARVGARFKGTNAIGGTRWSTKPVVTTADRDSASRSPCPAGQGRCGRTSWSPSPAAPR